MKILLYTNDIIEIKSHEHFIEIEQTYKRDQKISFFNDITQKYETSVLRHVELNNNKLYFNYKKKIWHRKLKNTTKKLRSNEPIEIKDIYHLKEIVQKYDRCTSLKINCEKCNTTKIWKIRPGYSNYNYDILMCPYCKEKYNNLQKYGVEHSYQRIEVRQKAKSTLLKNYGVENPSQHPDIHKKQLFGKYHAPNNKYYDSSWEYLFEQYLIENNIPYTYQANTTFKWFDIDNKEHTYIPDFSIINEGKEEFIEIKGDHFFDKNGNFINPYDKSEKGCINAKLKYECMKNANIKIYTSKDLINLGIKL